MSELISNNWEDLANSYEILLKEYELKFEGKIVRSKKLLSARLALLGSNLQLKVYEVKNGKSTVLQERLDLNNEIDECLSDLGSLEADNDYLLLLAKTAIKDRNIWYKKFVEIEDKIKQYEKFHTKP